MVTSLGIWSVKNKNQPEVCLYLTSCDSRKERTFQRPLLCLPEQRSRSSFCEPKFKLQHLQFKVDQQLGFKFTLKNLY